MKRIIGAGAAMLLGVLSSVAIAQDGGNASETRAIDARVVRVKLDGIIELRLRQGATPALVLSGDRRWLARTSATQHGDTLTIDTDVGEVKFNTRIGGLHAELTLPQLREVVSDSLGWTDISGFSGDRLDLSLDGAGSMKVNCDYRVVKATLGGLGSMTLQGGAREGVDLNLMGAGVVNLAGQARWLKANLGGLGGLNAQQFQADSVEIELGGLGNATVYARQSAALALSGLGSVTVYGKPPTRNVSVDGLGKVSWK